MSAGRGRRRGLAVLALALAAMLAGPTPASAQRGSALRVGELAPDFTLADQHGRPFTLTEALRARDFVVLAFYVKAFTGG